MQANVESACCILNDTAMFHRTCYCGDVSTMDRCQYLCSKDSGCKGYVMFEAIPDRCQLATISSCPAGCSRDYKDENNIGPIDPNIMCHIGTQAWHGGCSIKTGILLQHNIFSKV